MGEEDRDRRYAKFSADFHAGQQAVNRYAMTHDEHDQDIADGLNKSLRSTMNTEYRQDRLRRQLENDEPKCANCRCWARYIDPDPQSFGVCALSQQRTTDLTVCASWSPKG